VIHSLSLTGFKRFESIELPLRPLTLLTGFNSGGKSSVLQSILLARSALQRAQMMSAATVPLALNGDGLMLGAFRDVPNEFGDRRSFSMKLQSADETIHLQFTPSEGQEDSLTAVCEITGIAQELMRAHPLTRLRYVAASRVGPQEIYPLVDASLQETCGQNGELAYGNLWHSKRSPLRNNALQHPSEERPTFEHQVRAWMGTMFPDVEIVATPVLGANLLTIGIQMSPDRGVHRPNNVGFGVSCVLPIVITLLLAMPGDIVLIENPEIHLHPRAQVQIARLCATAAAAGVQVIVESHSDHILNGIRVAVHSSRIEADKVSILFFGTERQTVEASVHAITVDAQGRLSRWPEGFFDEEERLLDQLLQPNR
jgi:predicted ATPase